MLCKGLGNGFDPAWINDHIIIGIGDESRPLLPKWRDCEPNLTQAEVHTHNGPGDSVGQLKL